MKRRTGLLLGMALISAAIVGFITVADDVRHTGEFFAVVGLLLAGASFVGSALVPRLLPVPALHWTPLGIAAGALLGAVVDQVVFGVSAGVLCGLILARLLRAPGRVS